MSALHQIEAKAAAAPTPAPVVEPAGAPSLTDSPQTTSTPNWVRFVNFRHTGFQAPPTPVPNPRCLSYRVRSDSLIGRALLQFPGFHVVHPSGAACWLLRLPGDILKGLPAPRGAGSP